MKRLGIALVGLATALLAVALVAHRSHKSDRVSNTPAPASDPGKSAAPAYESHVDGTKIHVKIRKTSEAVGRLRIYVHSGSTPLGKCRVTFLSEALLNKHEPIIISQTDAGGMVLADNLPVGPWQLVARQRRYLPRSLEVTVSEGKTSEVSIELEEGSKFFGVITDSTGRPVGGADAYVLDDRKMDMGPSFHSTANDQGEYMVEGIPPIDCGLAVKAGRFKLFYRMGFTFAGPGQSQRVDVRLETGTSVSGTVTDEAGVPIPGATLIANTGSGDSAGSGRSKSEKDGSFAIYGLGDQPMNISASAPGYGTIVVHGIAPNSTGVQIRLPQAGSVSGTVAADGALEFFAVVLSRWDEYWKIEQPVVTHTFRNDGQGSFVVTDLAPGPYTLWIEATGYASSEKMPIVIQRGVKVENLCPRLVRKP